MFNRSKKKLSLDEIERAKEKILEEYDHLIVRCMKPKSIKTAFLDRYLAAMKARIDMTNFFHAELTAVKTVFQKETQKSARRPPATPSKARAGKADFADRIIEENLKRIQKYPDLAFHTDAAPEIRRMVGTLQHINSEYWPSVDGILRKSSATLYSNSRLSLEKKIYELAASRIDSTGNRLSGYLSILGRFPRDYSALEREGQLYLLSAAHFLHDLEEELSKLLESNNLDSDERIFVEKTHGYVHNVIVDFRLLELKPKNI